MQGTYIRLTQMTLSLDDASPPAGPLCHDTPTPSSMSVFSNRPSLPIFPHPPSLPIFPNPPSLPILPNPPSVHTTNPLPPDFLNPPAYLNFSNPTFSIPAPFLSPIESSVSLEELVTSFGECSDAESIPRIPPIVADQLQVYVRSLPPLLSEKVMEVLTDFQYPKKKFMTSKINRIALGLLFIWGGRVETKLVKRKGR